MAQMHMEEEPRFSYAALGVLLLSAVAALFWMPTRLLDNDEFLVLWTDSVPTLAKLVQVQLHSPISLDPMVYHGMTHFSLALFGALAMRGVVQIFALRLPSLLGFLLMQWCLYRFTRRFANERAAIFALAFPAVTATFFYAVEARPYALLLGWFALAMVGWQSAVRAETKRTGALVTLAVAIALALNTHYYGILIFVPIVAAEAMGLWQRRRVDWALLGAVAAGAVTIVFSVPFMRAAAVYRAHYYNASDSISLRSISQAYRGIFIDYTTWPMTMQRMIAVLFLFAVPAIVLGFVVQWRKRVLPVMAAELSFLVGLASLPIFGCGMAVVTHSYEARYVLGALLGITPIVAMALMPVFERAVVSRVVLAALTVAIVVTAVCRAHTDDVSQRQTVASLVLSPRQKQAVVTTPSGMIYVQELGEFGTAWYYQPDAQMQKRTAFIYSAAEELQYRNRDTNALTGKNLGAFNAVPTAEYEAVRQTGGPAMMLLYKDGGWTWIDLALSADHAQVAPVGVAGQGVLAAVRWAK